ncbi:hypothetical protein NL676_021085 [Syzygium grande]|nr:hypothetical protein NL676_021085 [Syzygium grande]
MLGSFTKEAEKLCRGSSRTGKGSPEVMRVGFHDLTDACESHAFKIWASGLTSRDLARCSGASASCSGGALPRVTRRQCRIA